MWCASFPSPFCKPRFSLRILEFLLVFPVCVDFQSGSGPFNDLFLVTPCCRKIASCGFPLLQDQISYIIFSYITLSTCFYQKIPITSFDTHCKYQSSRSEERREGKSVDLGGRRI